MSEPNLNQPITLPQMPLRLVTQAHGAGLENGEVTVYKNFRRRNRANIIRPAITKLATTGLPTPSAGIFRGAFVWQDRLWAAYKVGTFGSGVGEVALYYSLDGLTWTEKTDNSAAPQGIVGGDHTQGPEAGGTHNDRLTDSGDPVAFIATQQLWPSTGSGLTTERRLVISSGDNEAVPSASCMPRVTDGRNPNLSIPNIGIHRQTDGQVANSSPQVRTILPRYWDIGGQDDRTPYPASESDSGGGLTIDIAGGGTARPNRYWTLEAAIATAVGDYAYVETDQLAYTGAYVAGQSVMRQLAMVVKTENLAILENLTIEVEYSSTNFATIYTPRVPEFDFVVLPIGDEEENYYLVLITSDETVWLSEDLFGLRFTWGGGPYGAAADIAYEMDIVAVAWGGNWPGLTEYAVTLVNDDAMSESVPTLYRTGRAMSVAEMGGPHNTNIKIAELEEIYYCPLIPIELPSATAVARGVNCAFIYAKRPGDSEFGWVQNVGKTRFAPYAASNYTFAATTGWMDTPATGKIINFALYTYAGVNFLFPPPSEYHMATPPFYDALSAGERTVYVSGSEAVVSGMRHPLRQSDVPDLTSEARFAISPFTHRVPNDTLIAVKTTEMSTLTSNMAFLIGRNSIYGLDLYDARLPVSRLSTPGAICKTAVTTYRGYLAYLSYDREVIVFSMAEIQAIAKGLIGDVFQVPAMDPMSVGFRGIAGADALKVAAGAHNDILRFAVAPCNSASGAATGTNTRQWIYDMTAQTWSLDTVQDTAFNVAQYLNWRVAGRDTLLAFGDNGAIYEIDAPLGSPRLSGSVDLWMDYATGGMADGQPILGEIVSRFFNRNAIFALRGLRLGALSDGSTSAAAAVLLTGYGESAPTPVSTTLATNTSGVKWRITDVIGLRAPMLSYGFSVGAYAGWVLHSLNVELDESGGPGASVG